MKLDQRNIFIYGTLCQGGSAHHVMDGGKFLANGSIIGKIFHIDQYPGLILGGEQRVIGELYQVNDHLLVKLDRYEGCYESPAHYLREEVEILLENGEIQLAQVYVFQLLEPHHEAIESGDWIEWMKNKI
jgi:gamma-glutamylcyclotransferase (GGCT)/AIG2-like uncharacterized protein YtfP